MGQITSHYNSHETADRQAEGSWYHLITTYDCDLRNAIFAFQYAADTEFNVHIMQHMLCIRLIYVCIYFSFLG